MSTVISVENLSKTYHLGQIGTGTFTNDLKLWWARARGKPNPLLRIGEKDHGNRDGEELWALRDVSFTVQQGEVLGIIGRNGAGKSTLLKILSRVTAPTLGKIKVKGRIASLLEVGTGFHPELTGRENIYLNGAILGMNRKETDRKFDEIVDFAEVEKFIDTPVKRYSSGMYVRLAFAVAAHLEPEILVVDEVLAVGDAEFQKKCLGKMGAVAKEGRTVLFVSHNMEAILNLCPVCSVFEHGHMAYSGNSEDAVKFYLDSFSKQKKELPSHILFEGEQRHLSQSACILRIEVLDPHQQPKNFKHTWDDMIFRLHYVSDQKYNRGQFILDFFDMNQQRLIVCDSGSRLPIEQGTHFVDCYIPRFPLAAGEYYLGAGLAISAKQWLWRDNNLVLMQIHGRDVYELGRPPVSTRMIYVAYHKWSKD